MSPRSFRSARFRLGCADAGLGRGCGIDAVARRCHGAGAGAADFREEGRAKQGGSLGLFGTPALLSRGGFALGRRRGYCCRLGLLALARFVLGPTPLFLLLEVALFLLSLLFFGTATFFGLALGHCCSLGPLALSRILLGSALRLFFGTAAFFGLALGSCGCFGLLALPGLLLGSALRFLLGAAAFLLSPRLLRGAALLGCGGFAPGAFCLCCGGGDRRRD